MKIKKSKLLLLTLLSALAVTGCDNNKKDNPEPSIFSKTYNYNGLFTHFTFDDESHEGDFYTLFQTNFPTELSFRNSLLTQLGSVGNDPKTREHIYENQIAFGSIKNSHTRTYSGKEVTTYDVNPSGDKKLGEITVDPENNNQYRIISPDQKNPDGEYVLTPLLSRFTMSPYGKVDANVFDNGIVVNEDSFIFNYKLTMSTDKYSFTANGSFTFELKNGSEINFITQPTDVNVTSGDTYSFEVAVDHPELVLSYQWYSGAYNAHGEPYSLKALKGSAAKNRVLTIQSAQSKDINACYQCIVTTTKGEYLSNYARLTIEEPMSEVPSFYVLDRAIKPGSSLDLATTPYGDGTISYSEDGSLIEFDHVYFINKNMESCLQNIAMSIQSNYSKVSAITFKFVGTCVWNNAYWEDDHNQGGFALFMHYANDAVLPSVIFEGDPLMVIGGTRAINIRGNLTIKNSISIAGAPNRFTSGIFAHSINVKNGATITANIGGPVLSTLGDDDNRTGYIKIEDGVVIDATINAGKVNVGETQLFGFLAQTNLYVDNAKINLHFVLDYNFFASTKQYATPLIGMYSNSSTIRIANSDVNITMDAVNVPAKANALATAIEGIGGPHIIIDNADVNIKIDSTAFALVRGINTIVLEIVNGSNVKIFAHGALQITGIVSVFKSEPTTLFTNSNGLESNVKIIDSNLDIETIADIIDSEGKYYTDAGIRSHQYQIELSEGYFIHVKTNRASALVASVKYAYHEEDPSTFVPQYLLLDGLTKNPNTYTIEPDYYLEWNEDAKTNYYIILETLKVDSQFLTEITLYK